MNTWEEFKTELKRKISRPWKNPSFLGYFLTCVIVGGAAGVYISLYEHISSTEYYRIAFSLGTYYVAIMAAAFADINLSRKFGEKSSFFIYSLLFFLIGIVLLLLTYVLGSKESQWAFLPSSVGCILALFMWIIANAENEHFSESFDQNVRSNTINIHGNNWENNE